MNNATTEIHLEALRMDLIRQAQEDKAQYAQYDGYFDRHVLVVVRRKVSTKMGLAFLGGEIAIAAPAPSFTFPNSPMERLVYSVRTHCDTLLSASDIIEVR